MKLRKPIIIQLNTLTQKKKKFRVFKNMEKKKYVLSTATGATAERAQLSGRGH